MDNNIGDVIDWGFVVLTHLIKNSHGLFKLIEKRVFFLGGGIAVGTILMIGR